MEVSHADTDHLSKEPQAQTPSLGCSAAVYGYASRLSCRLVRKLRQRSLSKRKIRVQPMPQNERREGTMMSPCFTCTRVKDPQNCENKACKEWQAWFIDRWETMRANILAQLENSPLEDIGIPLGGQRYASPHRVREYRRQDPCQRCLGPKDLCRSLCPAKLAWSNAQWERNL